MSLHPWIRIVLATQIAASISSQTAWATAVQADAKDRPTFVHSLINPEHAEAIYRQLIELHWTPKTGLFRSFPDSMDSKVSQQASTYEQAAMGLLAIRFGDWPRAQQLFNFLKTTWTSAADQSGPRRGLRGLVNFYNADFGSEGVEKTIHAGPNAWAGLFAARLANATQNPEALQWALDVEYWLANVLPHKDGGIAMGPRDDPYGARWSGIYSTENNLSYYAFLTELLRSQAMEKNQRIAIAQERDRVENWLVNVAYDRSSGRVLRGINPSGRDFTQALDTVTWFISAVGPRRLAARGIDPERLLTLAQRTFEISLGNRSGVDATDQMEADRTYQEGRHRPDQINRPDDNHHRLIWYEGLGQYLLAWSELSDFLKNEGKPERAFIYMQKVHDLTAEFDRAALKQYPRQSAYPYATPGLFFRYGWGAPNESERGPATSLIAGIWRCFVGLGWDPMAGREVGTIEHARVGLPKEMHLAARKPAVLFGTSEDMVQEAWKALNAGDLDQAIAQAQATIQEWSSSALYLQKMKMREQGRLIDYDGSPEERKTVFKYWALNDVASAYFILGQALDLKKEYVKAARAFQQIVNHYFLAQVWDPKGWFWSPVEAISNDYVLRDRAHYGWVIPQAFAEGSRTGKTPY
jgi:hypothetical protein